MGKPRNGKCLLIWICGQKSWRLLLRLHCLVSVSFCKESDSKSVDWVHQEQVGSHVLIYLLGKKDKKFKEGNPKGYDKNVWSFLINFGIGFSNISWCLKFAEQNKVQEWLLQKARHAWSAENAASILPWLCALYTPVSSALAAYTSNFFLKYCISRSWK